jgi:hypothetical protein
MDRQAAESLVSAHVRPPIFISEVGGDVLIFL